MPITMATSLSMSQKVFVSLYRLSGKTDGSPLRRYCSPGVKNYPADFHLKGYPEFPDSGDAIHKPLYDYRKKGMVSASNKMFSLTPHGLAEASKLIAIEKGLPAVEPDIIGLRETQQSRSIGLGVLRVSSSSARASKMRSLMPTFLITWESASARPRMISSVDWKP